MRWIYLILATLCFVLLLKTYSLGLAIVGLVGMLGFLLAGVLSMVSARINSRSRDQGEIMDLDTLKKVRKLADAADSQPDNQADDRSDDQAPANPA